jgi:hypothetical protein
VKLTERALTERPLKASPKPKWGDKARLRGRVKSQVVSSLALGKCSS